jgi:hypothetical protein
VVRQILSWEQKVDELLATKGPESTYTLSLRLFTKLDNRHLLNDEGLGELVELKDLNELGTLEDVILLDTTLFGKLLELDERQRIHG